MMDVLHFRMDGAFRTDFTAKAAGDAQSLTILTFMIAFYFP
jgi:hypothetical protein